MISTFLASCGVFFIITCQKHDKHQYSGFAWQRVHFPESPVSTWQWGRVVLRDTNNTAPAIMASPTTFTSAGWSDATKHKVIRTTLTALSQPRDKVRNVNCSVHVKTLLFFRALREKALLCSLVPAATSQSSQPSHFSASCATSLITRRSH